MAIVLPIEISRMIIDCVEDKKTLLNLLFTTNAFRLLVEPHLYADVSLINAPATPDPTRYRRPVLDTVLWAVSRSFLHGITAGGGRCARYVKRLHLPAFCLQNGEQQYAALQTILKSVTDLEHLQIYSWWNVEPVDLQVLLGNPKSRSSPPPFTLRSFVCYMSGGLDSFGLGWFLSHQKSLERLFLPSCVAGDPHRSMPLLPRLRVLDACDQLDKAGNMFKLDDAALRHIVVCVVWDSISSPVFTTVARMPNLECLELDIHSQSFADVLTRLHMLKGAPRLRYLRILLRGVFDGTEDEDPMISPMISPWGYEDMVKAFDSLLSLTQIIVQFTRGPGAPEYFCFAKGAARPVKLRSLRLPPEWWHDDWVQDCVVIPFQQGDRRMGYTGDLLGGVGNL
ncbi:hypothetical protein EYR36_008181 [Pleurotus pulmonarius]|nr:hypothetical protein EYR36_008181 [Pleurotus pulmonarius]